MDRPAESGQVEVVGRVLEGLRIEFGRSNALLVGQVRLRGVEREPSRSVGMDVVRLETAITRPLVKCTARFRPNVESRRSLDRGWGVVQAVPWYEGQPVAGGDRHLRTSGGKCGDVRRKQLPRVDIEDGGQLDLTDPIAQGYANGVLAPAEAHHRGVERCITDGEPLGRDLRRGVQALV